MKIMDHKTELKNTAKMNKNHLKGKSLIVDINGSKYALQISGIGQKSVRLSLFVSYEDLIEYKNHHRLENMLYEKINTVYEPKKKGSIWRVSK